MEIMNSILDYLARTNLFNFIIFALIIIFLIKKLNVSAKMESSVDSVKETIEESETAKTESEEKLSNIEESMTHLSDEIDAILAESNERAQLVGSKIIEDANKTANIVKDNAQKSLENSTILLKNDIIRRASLASIEIAKSYILEELSKNAELHDKLIDESIEKIEGVEL